MDTQPVLDLSDTPGRAADAFQAARSLGELISRTPEYQDFLQALKAVNGDVVIQSLSSQMRACRLAVQWGREVAKNTADLERLEQEIGALPAMQTYRRAEETVRSLVLAVDEAISREAGVDFAANAKRSCCG